MKSRVLAGACTGLFLLGVAQGQTYTTNVSSTTVNTPVPDGSTVGIASSANISGALGLISSVSVSLDITGGYNGDLYAYLTGPSGQIAILLNRSGLSGSDPFGYSDPGFNITLSDGSPNIHDYQLPIDDATYNGDGQLTGTWAPDARNIDPQSSGATFDATDPNPAADLSSFVNGNADGNWTLFVADLSAGGQATLVSWGLTVVTVPEPQTWLLLAGGIGMLVAFNRHRKL
jgi:subtilisin-like proprotein convertase family protein